MTYHSGLSWSMSDIQTQREVLRHTAKRMAIAVSLTAVMTLATVTCSWEQTWTPWSELDMC